MLTRSRRILVAAVAGTLAVLLAGCGTSFNAQTNAVYQSGIGTNNRSADVEVLNALFVKNDDGSATLSAGLVNQTLKTDRLTDISVTTRAGTPVEVTFDNPVAVPARRLVSLGTKPHAVVTGPELFEGQFLNISLTFTNAGVVELPLPIVSRSPMYDKVAQPAPVEDEPAAEDDAATDDAATTDEQ